MTPGQAGQSRQRKAEILAGARGFRDVARLRAAYHQLRRRWPQFQMLLDGAIWLLALPSAALLRYDFTDAGRTGRVWLAGLISACAFLGIGITAGLYRRRFRYASFDELATLTTTAAATGLLLFGANLIPTSPPLARSVPLIGTLVALVGTCGARYAARRLLNQLSRPDQQAAPVIIYGAGAAGAQLVASMGRNPASPYRPVALLDDHPAKAKLTIEGIRVVGGRAHLRATAARTGARLVVLAMPGADGAIIRELAEAIDDAGLVVKTLPSISELGSPTVDTTDIRPITEADLLGRRQLDTDIAAIAGYVRGKRILVTGAGGSIGSELCRQLHQFDPDLLVMLDRDESALHAVQLSIEGRALLETPNLVVADIRDADRLFQIFELHRPQVVFHAAALKHLPLLELHPEEGIKTNIWGTQNLLDAAQAYDVERFVNISTDKAANPASVLGYTKRIAERLTAYSAQRTGRPYISVRFGNVLGSRGSMLPTFQTMVEAGGPITVTHPDVTRYFMTIPEAVQLVIQAGAIGDPSEVLILDMGQPVRIVDVARRLIHASGKPIAIVYTGLRPGEKLHEELVSTGEIGIRRAHPLITHAIVPPLAPHGLARHLHTAALATALSRLAVLGTAEAR